MIYVLCFIISFLASIVGSICGIGGGVIIKPVLDATGVFGVATISFLSGCTVLAMSICSIVRNMASKSSEIDFKISTPLGIGAIVGGIIGKQLFSSLLDIMEANVVGAFQSIGLTILTIGTLAYTINKNKIKTYKFSTPIICLIIGVCLGTISSFLGIGGGPINLVVLYFFFSMETKTAAQNSLYIVMFSQLSSLGQTIFTSSIPEFSYIILIGMMICGITGAIVGKHINEKIEEVVVEKLFIILMIFIILINIYNFFNYL